MSCFDAILWGGLGNLGMLPIALGILQIACFFGVAIWQQILVRRSLVNTEIFGYQPSMLLSPSYTWILWAFGCSMLVLGIVHIAVGMPPVPRSDHSIPHSIGYGIAWGFFHMVVEGTAFFLCKQGVGYSTFLASIKQGLLWGIFIGFLHSIAFLSFKWADGDLTAGFMVQLSYESLILVFYLALAFTPSQVWKRRQAVIQYSKFWIVSVVCDIVGLSLMYWNYDCGYCIYLATNWGVLGLLKPYVLYTALRKDSDYWQGVDDIVHPDNPNQPLLRSADVNLSTSTARHISNCMGALSTQCTIINFACLKINNHSVNPRDLLGGGGTARVYTGQYFNNNVAIKMIYPFQLNVEVIDRFCQETSLLSSIRHPNIVHIEGVCVIPPCVCMVMELCKGNLCELLRARGVVWNWDLILSVALDCTRAVACLHHQQVR